MSENGPKWAELLRPGYAVEPDGWGWASGKLVQTGAAANVSPASGAKRSLGNLVVEYCYGRQNRAAPVRQAVSKALASISIDGFGLNFGGGSTRLHERLLNLDLMAGSNVDIVSNGDLTTPFADSTLDVVLTQEVVEHLAKPEAAVNEFHRVLKPGGTLLLQVPFIIGYHPGPTDYWRFTVEAFDELLPSSEWEIIERNISVGHGSGFYRILVEFLAVHFSIFGGRIYRLAKGLFAVVFSPLALLDHLTPYLPEKHRIPGGYVVLAKARKNH
jgi:SAM-dependent methyltransferase